MYVEVANGDEGSLLVCGICFHGEGRLLRRTGDETLDRSRDVFLNQLLVRML